uniref:Uncharacterized protein n=1 Tax=Panagrolaimus superbus TaxID=310955 RepID=A0A914Z9X1_9BILA
MSGFIDSSAVDAGCGNHRAHNNNGFPIIILCVILATCLLMVSVAVIAMFHRLYVSHKSKDNRKPSYCTRKTVSIFFVNIYNKKKTTSFIIFKMRYDIF